MIASVFGRSLVMSRWVLLGAVLGLAACDSPEERAQKHFDRGVALAAEGADQKALLEFRNTLKLVRDHAPARREVAKLHERRNDYAAAASSFRTAAELDPADAESRYRLAQILMVAGQLDEARRLADEAAAAAPDSADARATKAAVALRLGSVEVALAEARAALAIDPAHVGANVVLISERLEAGDRVGALAQVDSLLAAEPGQITYELVKLQILSTGEDAAALGAHLEHMAGAYPQETQYRRALGLWRRQNGDPQGALAEFRKLADGSPDAAEPVLDLVRLLIEIQGVDAARSELETRAASASPALAAQLRLALADLEAENGRLPEAKAILGALVEAGGEPRDVNTARIKLATLLMRERDPAAAMALVAAVLSEDAKNVDALAIRASVAIDEERPQDAIADIRAALDVDPQNARLMLLEASAHERDGNLTLAGERLAAATRASAYDPDIAGRYAGFLRARKELRAAEAVLSETARQHPASRTTLTALADVRLQLQDWAGAEQAAAMLRALEDGDALADQVQAAVLGGQGRTAESVSVLERLAARPESSGAAMATLVAGYVRAGQVDKATAFLDEVIADDPDNLRALLLRAELHLLRNEPDRVEEVLRRAVTAAPTDPLSYAALARFLIQTGRADEAEEVTLQGIERVPEAENLHFLNAQLLEQRGAFDEAIATYERLYDLNPASAVYANNLASLLAEHREQDASAMALASRVAQRLRGYDIPHFQDTYGWVTFLNGDAKSALETLSRAAEALPNNSIVRYHAGRVYAALGEAAQARTHLEAALAIDPGFPKAASARATLDELEQAPAGQ